MRSFLIQAWQRFRSDVPATERKLQLIMIGASTTFGSMAAITWPGSLAIAGTVCGYASACCGGMAFLLQFAVQVGGIIDEQPIQNKKMA